MFTDEQLEKWTDPEVAGPQVNQMAEELLAYRIMLRKMMQALEAFNEEITK